MLKIILLSIFSQLDVSEVYNQVNNKPKLLKFLNINELQSLKQIKELYSRHNENKYLELALKSLNNLNFKQIRNIKTIIVDSTSITLDLKFNGKYLTKQKLLTKDYKRCYSTNNKHYAGFKMTLTIEYRTYKPLTILIHKRCPNNTKIFDEHFLNLKKKNI